MDLYESQSLRYTYPYILLYYDKYVSVFWIWLLTNLMVDSRFEDQATQRHSSYILYAQTSLRIFQSPSYHDLNLQSKLRLKLELKIRYSIYICVWNSVLRKNSSNIGFESKDSGSIPSSKEVCKVSLAISKSVYVSMQCKNES